MACVAFAGWSRAVSFFFTTRRRRNMEGRIYSTMWMDCGLLCFPIDDLLLFYGMAPLRSDAGPFAVAMTDFNDTRPEFRFAIHYNRDSVSSSGAKIRRQDDPKPGSMRSQTTLEANSYVFHPQPTRPTPPRTPLSDQNPIITPTYQPTMTSPLPPTTIQSLLYPTVSPTLSHLPRHTHSPPTARDRLLSILSDSVFTETVSKTFALPLVANERCGSWYINPSPPVAEDLLPVGSAWVSSPASGSSSASGSSPTSVPSGKVGSAYFKSTDGHHGQWAFSTRRLNLGVLEVVGRYGG